MKKINIIFRDYVTEHCYKKRISEDRTRFVLKVIDRELTKHLVAGLLLGLSIGIGVATILVKYFNC